MTTIVLAGDINLIGIDEPSVPFRKLDILRSADFALANLECCLYDPPEAREMMRDDVSGYEGLYASASSGVNSASRSSCAGPFTATSSKLLRSAASEVRLATSTCAIWRRETAPSLGSPA